MTLRVPSVTSTAHSLSPELRQEIRAAAFKQTEQREAHPIWTKEYEDWCDCHYSNGMPMPSAPEYVTVTLGIVDCALCGELVDNGEQLCPRCLNTAVEPHRADHRERTWRTADPNGVRL